MQVIPNLLKRGDELRKNPSARYEEVSESGLRSGILFTHGGMNAAWGAGVCNYLEQRNFSYVVDVMVAVNPAMAFLQSKQTHILRNIFCEELLSRGFIRRGFLRKIVSVSVLEDILRSDRFFNTESVKRNPCPLYVGVTDANGNGELIDAKAPDVDLVDALMATVTLPVKGDPPKVIGGSQWFTGSLAVPIPVVEMVEKFKLTDLLVILNDPSVPLKIKRTASFLERKAAPLFIRPFTPGLVGAYLNRKEVCRSSLARALGGIIGDCRVEVIAPAPEFKVSKLCLDRDILAFQYLTGHKAMRIAFGDTP